MGFFKPMFKFERSCTGHVKSIGLLSYTDIPNSFSILISNALIIYLVSCLFLSLVVFSGGFSCSLN